MSGIGTRLLKLKVGATEVTAQVSKAVLTSNDAGSDFTTFEDAANGGRREYRLEFTAVQDTATGTLWDQVFSNAGDSVDFLLGPYGGDSLTDPSPAAPIASGTATITEPDGDMLGGEANSSTSARMVFSCAWVLDAKWVMIDDPDDL